jgi:hypothetical protein
MKNNGNYAIVNNSCCDIRPFDAQFFEAYRTGFLCEELADLFTLRFIRGFNDDGSDRMIIESA